MIVHGLGLNFISAIDKKSTPSFNEIKINFLRKKNKIKNNFKKVQRFLQNASHDFICYRFHITDSLTGKTVIWKHFFSICGKSINNKTDLFCQRTAANNNDL